MGGSIIPSPLNLKLTKLKSILVDMPEGVFSIGRAGKYEYGYDIDNCIESALEIGKKSLMTGNSREDVSGLVNSFDQLFTSTISDAFGRKRICDS